LFRRNIQKSEDGQIQRKAILLTGTVIIILLLVNWTWDLYSQQAAPNTIEVKMLAKDAFIVEHDTTNYTNFASILKKAVVNAKQTHAHNQIELNIPTAKKTKEVADVIMVVMAMNLDWQLSNE